MKHKLKIEERYYERLCSGEKTCEVRFDDRDYQVGDILEFDRWYPFRQHFQITHIQRWIGLKDGYVCLSIKKITINRNGKVVPNVN